MRRLTPLFCLLLAAPLAAEPRERDLASRLGVGGGEARVEWREDGRVAEIEGVSVAGIGSPAEDAARTVARLGDLLHDAGEGTEIRRIEVRESLTGTHVRFGQFLGGERVVGGELVLRYDEGGDLVSLSNRLGTPGRIAGVERPIDLTRLGARTIVGRERIAFAEDGVIRIAERVVTAEPPFGVLAWDFDPGSGELLRITPDYWLAREALVFDGNPVSVLNDPALRDENDSAHAVPQAGYARVELEGLDEGAGLSGRLVRIIDHESPKTAPIAAEESLLFDRSMPGFEEVNAWFQIDRSLRFVESLGYSGSRAIVTTPLTVDAHAVNGADQSFYRFGGGEGTLLFGDGGVDDAEDADIVLHELGHAIQDAIAPFAFAGSFSSQARAAGEGFGDYWAFSAGYEGNLASGRDPSCIGDWDARCWETASTNCGYPAGSDCLRRVDSPKTMDDFLQREQSGIEHRNGEIWSAALREIFLSITGREGVERGKRIADSLVLEGHFGVPPTPSFRTLARRMIEADRLLHAGVNRSSICSAMIGRRILGAADCELVPRGGFTLFQADHSPLPIPDGVGAGVRSTRWIDRDGRIEELRVRVRIRHPHRGELRIQLTGPNGRTILLQRAGADSGADIDTVYGLDVDPHEPLSTFYGADARGEWTLTVIDTLARDEGELVSWGLEIRFEGDLPLEERARSGADSLAIPAVARTPGAAGTFFVSDLRLLNRGAGHAEVTVLFTPSGGDGAAAFAAFGLSIAPGQQVALDDVVGADFRSDGLGNLEIRGDTADLVVTSRTYNAAPDGTYGQFVPSASLGEAASAGGEPLHLTQLRNDSQFRSNLGLSEVAGSSAVVGWVVIDAEGRPIDEGSAVLAPWSHLQVPLLGGEGGQAHSRARAEIVVTGGEGRVVGYGSVVDNRTGDAIFVPGHPAFRDSAGHLAAVIRGAGANDTSWRSDLWLSNLDATDGTFVVSWFSPDGQPRAAAVPLAAGASTLVSDLLGTLFGAESGTGRVRIESSVARWSSSSRTWTPGGGGSYGQFVPIEAEGRAVGVGEAVAIPQLSIGEAYRTNLGLAEVSSLGARVRIGLRDGGGREVWSTEIELEGGRQMQLGLGPAGAPSLASGYAWIEVVGGDGRILAYGSVVDNRTGDPIWVPGT
ncbi:MAG TPA: proprotein convertase P-domain-containing protein [Thermoanaerobaculia bacterium]|nr:proprotein convertase P-domain-containing protein [Thermoanaerobaculia bacterium]